MTISSQLELLVRSTCVEPKDAFLRADSLFATLGTTVKIHVRFGIFDLTYPL